MSRGSVILVALVIAAAFFLLRRSPSYDTAFNLVLREEGIVSETVKQDLGGRTTLGIASRYWPKQEAEAYRLLVINKDRAGAIQYSKDFYYKYFWVPAGANLIPDPALAYMVLDSAVNQGVASALATLALSAGSPDKFSRLRADKYKRIILADPSQKVFAQDWFRRNDRYRLLSGLPGIADQYLATV